MTIDKKRKNPLFVVQEGTVVEADGALDFWVKKLGLEPLLNILEKIIT